MFIPPIEQDWIIFFLLLVTDSPKKKKNLYAANSRKRVVGVCVWMLFLDIANIFHPRILKLKNIIYICIIYYNR